MARRTKFLWIFYALVFILNSILHAYSKDCLISRAKRDKITTFVNRTSCTLSNNPCSAFGGILELTNSGCICVCPSSKPTYMRTTSRCAASEDVSSKCNLRFRRQLAAIPIFSSVYSTSLRINIPKKFNRCKMVADKSNSFYLSRAGWSKLAQKYEFPFLVVIAIIRKRLRITNMKWKTNVPSELVGKVFRLGITCGKRKDCITFKIAGNTFDQCIQHPTTMLPVAPSPSSLIPLGSTRPTKHVGTNNAPFTGKTDITTEQHTSSTQLSPSRKSRASSSMEISWSVIGTVIGIMVALLLGIVILAVCFWRKRKKSLRKKQNSNAATQSSGGMQSSSERQPEVTYASPLHPYQELKPSISGTPRGTYQSLKWKAKEDASGYLLPSESTATNYPDPLYNEIGSPKHTLPLVYDYALPDDTVRFSKQLLGIDNRLNDMPQHDTRNGSDYVGRTSRDQEEPNSPSSTGAVSAPLNDDLAPPAYLDFTREEGANLTELSECRNPENILTKGTKEFSKYKKPVNGPKSPLEKSSPQDRTYQTLEPPGAPVNAPLGVSLQNLEDKRNMDSTA